MDRNEFVSVLRAVLAEELPASVVEGHVSYYQNYISQEIAGGKSEEEVLEQLGDPRLIARTILDTQQGQSTYYEAYDTVYTQEDAQEREKGFHAEMNSDGGIDIKYRRLNLNTWYGKLLVVLVLILVFALIFAIIGGIIAWVLPIVLPVLLIVWLLRMFSGRR